MEVLFASERLLFREFTIEDTQLIFDLNADPEVTKFLHQSPVTKKSAEKLLSDVILPQYKNYNHGRWAVFLETNFEFIGWCGLKRRPELTYPDLGYRFFKRYWGNGYATEAANRSIQYGFIVLQLPGIFAAAHIDNIKSWQVLEKCGMEFKGIRTIDNAPAKTYEIINPFS